MDLPILDNFAPSDRVDSTPFSGANSAPAETDASFANLLARREKPVDSTTTREDERDESPVDEATPMAAPAPPVAQQPSDDEAGGTMNTGRGEQASDGQPTEADGAYPPDLEGERLTTAEALDEAALEDAPATSVVVATKVIEPAQPNTDQRNMARALPEQGRSAQAESSLDVPAASRDTTNEAQTKPHSAPQTRSSTESSELRAEPDGAVADEAAHSKRNHKRPRSESGKSEKPLRGPAGGKGTLPRQVMTAAAAAGVAADLATDQQQLVSNRANEQDAESAELRAPTDQDSRAAASVDRSSEHLPMRGSVRSQGGREMSQVDRTRLIQRVARAIHAAPQQGGVIRLRLRPPELGSLHLEVSMEKGGLSARLEAETQTARGVLLDNLPQLRERLAEQGIRIERFDVDVSQQDAGQSQQQTDQTNDPFEPLGPELNGSNQEEPVDDLEMATEATHIVSQRNLNVVI